MEIRFRGKMSTFGGPADTGMSPTEGLALVNQGNFNSVRDYFLSTQTAGTPVRGRKLNPDKFYIACRWNYQETSKAFLISTLVTVRNPINGMVATAKPVDWGPNLNTGRVADLSPGLAHFLHLGTDDVVEVTLSPGAQLALEDEIADAAAATSVRVLRYTYKQAESFRHGRTETIQNIIVHSTDGRESGDVATLTGPNVSVHWYVTRAGKIYHFVDNSDTAFHAGVVTSSEYSNAATIGIEQEHFDPDPQHGRPNNEDWPEIQITTVANLCTFLCQRYGLTENQIHSHAFVASPPGRKQDPFGYPFDQLKAEMEQASAFTWVAQPV